MEIPGAQFADSLRRLAFEDHTGQKPRTMHRVGIQILYKSKDKTIGIVLFWGEGDLYRVYSCGDNLPKQSFGMSRAQVECKPIKQRCTVQEAEFLIASTRIRSRLVNYMRLN